MKILIAGGGIGGLTAALALQARDHDVTVLESVREPKPLGVGINLLPHAVGVLDSLGLLPALRGMAVETSALVFANRHGQAIHRDARGLEGGYSHPQFSIHRGELQMLLWREASAKLAVLSGQRVVGVHEESGRAVAEIETADGRRALAADLVVVIGGPVPATDAAEGDTVDRAAERTAGAWVALAHLIEVRADGTVLASAEASTGTGDASPVTMARTRGSMAEGVSTVDVPAVPMGRAAIVLALVEQREGASGHYGLGQSVDGPLPATS